MDPDLTRLVGGDSGWTKVYRQGMGGRLLLWVLIYLMGVLTLMAAAMGLGVVALAVNGLRKAGSLGAAWHELWNSMGCGIFVVLGVGFLLARALRKGWSQVGRLWKDRDAPPEILRGPVESLEEESGYRGAKLYYLGLQGRRISIGDAAFKALRQGQPVVVEIKPYGPTLLTLLAKD
ncbi:MAG TPA: hypothetical protein VJ483_02585 [Holophagaceae bacterium]|nr:hypothetical protein [Holophagaceae bacterium]